MATRVVFKRKSEQTDNIKTKVVFKRKHKKEKQSLEFFDDDDSSFRDILKIDDENDDDSDDGDFASLFGNSVPEIKLGDVNEIKRDEQESSPNTNKENDFINNLFGFNPSESKKDSKSDEKKRKKMAKKAKKEEKKRKKLAKKGIPDIGLFTNASLKEEDKEKNNYYEKRFGNSLRLLGDLYKEATINTNESKEILDGLKNCEVNGHRIKFSPVAISSQTSSLASMLNSKLSIIKEITSVNKTISDFELKRAKELGAIEGGGSGGKKGKKGKGAINPEDNAELFLDKYFDEIYDKDAPKYDYDKENEKSKKKLNKKIEDLEDNGEIEYTVYEKAIKYENQPVNVVISKDMKSGKWEFMALDEDGNELDDYPLPNKKDIGGVTFSKNGDYATDKTGANYDVVLKPYVE